MLEMQAVAEIPEATRERRWPLATFTIMVMKGHTWTRDVGQSGEVGDPLAAILTCRAKDV